VAFPRIWACFLWSCGVFWRHAGCLFLGLFLLKFACFLGLFVADFSFLGLLFFVFYGTFAVSIYWLQHIGRVFLKICSFWACFCGFASLLFYLIFLLIFILLKFPANAWWPCFMVYLPIFGLFSKFTCLFLQNNLASLQIMLGKAKRWIESFWVKSSNWSKSTKHRTTVWSEAAAGKSVRSGKLCANVICPDVWRHTQKKLVRLSAD